MKQFIKRTIVILLCNSSLYFVQAGVVTIGSFENTRVDSAKLAKSSKQIVIRNNQVINRSIYLANTSNDHNPDLIISAFVIYEVTQDTDILKYPITREAKKVEFNVTPMAFLKINKFGTMTIENHAQLHLLPCATLEISDSALIYLSNGSNLVIDSGAVLIIKGEGELQLSNESKIYLSPYSNLILQHKNSTIMVGKGCEIITEKEFKVSYIGTGKIYTEK